MTLNKRTVYLVLAFTMAAALYGAAADDTRARIGNAVKVLNDLTESPGHGIWPEQIAKADCAVIIPGFKKGAAGVGVGFGRGFISCRNGDNWSAPGAVTLQTTSLGTQLGGERIDIVVLSLDKDLRPKLLSDRLTIGSDVSAAWGNGKSAASNPDVKVLFFAQTKGIFAGFSLDGANLKPDDSSNRALYGKSIGNAAIVGGQVATPAVAQPLVATLKEKSSH
jgi:lipid-binding SYLF domain-containing protein